MIFSNNNGEMIDVLIENRMAFKPTKYTKIGQFLAEDIFDILIEEKPALKDYDTVKITRVIESFYRFDEKGSLPQEVKYHQVHISCTHGGFMVGGSEHIEDLPQKIRQRKLEKILNE
jgi:hypothetical protein